MPLIGNFFAMYLLFLSLCFRDIFAGHDVGLRQRDERVTSLEVRLPVKAKHFRLPDFARCTKLKCGIQDLRHDTKAYIDEEGAAVESTVRTN